MKKNIALLVAAGIILGAVLLAGCAKPPTAKEILGKTAAAYKQVKSMKVEADNSERIEVDGQWQSRGNLVLSEYQKPDKIRQQSVGQELPSMVTDGKKAFYYHQPLEGYISIPPENVVKVLTGDQGGVHALRFLLEKEPFKDVKNVKLMRSEKLGDVDAYVVEFSPDKAAPPPGMEKAKIVVQLWVGKEDFLVRKGMMIAKESKTDKKTGKHTAILTVGSEVKEMTVGPTISASRFALPKDAKMAELPKQPGGLPPGR